MIQRQINFYCFQLVMNGRNLGDLDEANQMQHVTV